MNKNLKVLGLMSGTSADGLSMAYCIINLKERKLKVKAYSCYNYPLKLRKDIENARSLSLSRICQLNFNLGRLWADFCQDFLVKFNLPVPDLVSSHGQTVFHDSKKKITLQIGEISFITETLKTVGVSDFRPQDIAAGGEGAPLVPFFDEFVFSDLQPCALVNIGGVANISFVASEKKTLGFDVGPGNSLMDWAVSFYSKGRFAYDKNGQWAMRGKADTNRAKAFLKLPFFNSPPPKSLDREDFGFNFLKKNFNLAKEKKEDVLATLNLFTALCIKKSLSFLPLQPQKIIISGGGAFNRTLMKNLSAELPFCKVISIEKLGFHPLAKEPAAFALLGALCFMSKPNCPYVATGAKGERILGKISYPFGLSKL